MSAKELFDVVDENDEVIGVLPRAEVHRERRLHRAVHIFVFNAAGELFLQRRSLSKDSAPGKWVSSCSGHVDSGEVYEIAAKRELVEEIGLAWPSDTKRLFKVNPCPATGYEFVWLYTCTAEGPFQLDPNEISEGKWVALPELNDWISRAPRDFAWSFIHIWRKYLATKA